MGRDLMIFLCSLMLVELVAENLHIARLKARSDEKDQKIVDLEAKLCDEVQEEGSEEKGADV